MQQKWKACCSTRENGKASHELAKATSPSEHRLTKVHAITTKVRRTPTHTAGHVKRTLNDHGRSANRCRGSIRGRCVVRVQKVQEEIGTHENPVRVPRSATNCLFAERAVTPRALAMMICCFSCIFTTIKQKARCDIEKRNPLH